MKSNKQKYKDTLGKSVKASGQGGGGDNGFMWIIMFIIIFALLYSTRAAWCTAIGVCTEDLSIGTENPLSNGIGEQR